VLQYCTTWYLLASLPEQHLVTCLRRARITRTCITLARALTEDERTIIVTTSNRRTARSQHALLAPRRSEISFAGASIITSRRRSDSRATVRWELERRCRFCRAAPMRGCRCSLELVGGAIVGGRRAIVTWGCISSAKQSTPRMVR